jgi:hypothetical protein
MMQAKEVEAGKEKEGDVVVAEDEKRGRKRAGEGRKRKNTLLKLGNPAGGESTPGPSSSSLESSPAPSKLPIVTPKSTRKVSQSINPSPQLQICPQHPGGNPKPSPSPSPSPYTIPLPTSPAGSSSSKPLTNLESEPSLDGDDLTSESAFDNNESTIRLNGKTRSDGWSIIPEDGYLPIFSAPLSSNKKKKRKPKLYNSAPPPPPITIPSKTINLKPDPPALALDMDMAIQPELGDNPSPLPIRPPQTPRTPSSRHARKASLTRPLNVEYEALLDERDAMIESLRTDIGVAKVQEARALVEVEKRKESEERGREEVERSRKVVESGQKRENEVSCFLTDRRYDDVC